MLTDLIWIFFRVLHTCHGVLFKHLCGWMLYGHVYDPFHEFFIQPCEKGTQQSHDQTDQSPEEEDELGIMGVTGRQLQVCSSSPLSVSE